MKARNLLLLVVFLVVGSLAATAQTLAEVAKKEKERREKNRTDASRVITERELSRSYSGLPATSSTVTNGESSESESADSPGTSPEREGEAAAQDETQTREYWQNRLNAAREKVASLEKRLSEESWGEGQRYGVDPRGQNNLAQRQEAEQQLAAARAEVQAIQSEARRAGVPPGWVR
ncbi:MAG TPA: hypothetical protein VLK65_26885 [Vicinamibacteria bacterium]|nr:hypothetical protein [Vicinamibacteria bacterium]